MKKLLALGMLLVILAASLASCTKTVEDWKYIEENGKMTIGITIYDPMNYYEADGTTLTGFDTEFAQAVCAKLGVQPSFQVIDWEQKESMLKAKNIDAIWNGLTVTEERRDNMDFTRSYLVNKQVVVIHKDDAETYTSTASLKDALLTAEKKSAGETAIGADSSLSKATYTPSTSQQNALLSLVAGNVDAIVIDYTMAKAFCGKGDYADFMIVESIELANEEYAIGFRVGSDMTKKVNAIIDELIEDGTLAAIAAKYDMTELYEEAIKD